jgi:peptidoglycan/LPS O-acetylase OafA/YrhL
MVMILVVTLVVRFAYPAGLYPNLRMADISALFYFSNWWQIATSSNYFVVTGAVSPLTHTWSLAVEEQFYLVWPLVAVGVLHVFRKFGRGIEALLVVAVAGAIASSIEMDRLFSEGVNPTRLYFGTDTHAQSILVGAVLACILTLVQRRRGLEGMAPTVASRIAKIGLTIVGLLGLAGTVILSVSQSGAMPFAYRGGFLLSALSAAGIIIGAVCVARGPIALVLSLRPVVWMGTVSYGAYLWHFPVWIAASGAHTGLSGLVLLGLRTGLTFLLAALSYYFVERPVIEGTFWRSLRALRPAVIALVATSAIVVVATIAPAVGAVPNHSARVVSSAEHQALVASGAYGADPVRFLVVGDSTALTLAYGLDHQSVERYGVDVINAGTLACDFDDLAGYLNGGAVAPYGYCRDWQGYFAALVAGYHPEVVGLLMGRWIGIDHVTADGRTVSLDEPGWDAHVQGELETAVRILSAAGAKVVLFTAPYFDPPVEAPNGTPFPENNPKRVDEWNTIVRNVAAVHPGEVSVIDLNKLVDPNGHYQSVVDGVTVRWPDGIHFSLQGGEWLQPYILPTVAQLGLSTRPGAA